MSRRRSTTKHRENKKLRRTKRDQKINCSKGLISDEEDWLVTADFAKKKQRLRVTVNLGTKMVTTIV